MCMAECCSGKGLARRQEALGGENQTSKGPWNHREEDWIHPDSRLG